MASRAAASRRVPENEAAITYVQCDGLVSETSYLLDNELHTLIFP